MCEVLYNESYSDNPNKTTTTLFEFLLPSYVNLVATYNQGCMYIKMATELHIPAAPAAAAQNWGQTGTKDKGYAPSKCYPKPNLEHNNGVKCFFNHNFINKIY